MKSEMNATLFAQTKRQLDITWSDSDTDKKVKQIMSSAEGIISHQLGVKDFDFSEPGMENTLYHALCLYLWNHVELKTYYENYGELIQQTRAKHEVERTKNAGI